jgi:hypothetical protein
LIQPECEFQQICNVGFTRAADQIVSQTPGFEPCAMRLLRIVPNEATPSWRDQNLCNENVRNMVHVVLYGADKAVIVYIVHSELYRIIILNNNYNYYSIDITASALYS